MRCPVTGFALALWMIWGLLPQAGHADTIAVPGDYPTIAEGMENASGGDMVLVDEGTYSEILDFQGKSIVVRSANGPENTIIDGGQGGSVVSFKNGESPSSVLEGFTIRNGTGTGDFLDTRGGGLYIVSSSPSIQENVISCNSARETGGGIYCQNASPRIICNVVSSNECFYGRGGGIACREGSNPIIYGNEIAQNLNKTYGAEGGGIAVENSEPIIINNLLQGNRAPDGGGIYLYNSPVQILNNTITANEATDYYGGGLFVNECSPVITHNIISNNTANHGAGVYADVDGFPVFTNNLFWNNRNDDTYGCDPGGDDLFEDPLFVPGPRGECYLSQTAAGEPEDSPCLNAGVEPASTGGFDTLTTRSDEIFDAGSVDLGYHYRLSSPDLAMELSGAPSQVNLNSYISWLVRLNNLSPRDLTVDLWIRITGPLPSDHSVRIIVKRNLPIESGASRKIKINALVPSSVPVGNYFIDTIAGKLPDTIYAKERFDCQVIWNRGQKKAQPHAISTGD